MNIEDKKSEGPGYVVAASIDKHQAKLRRQFSILSLIGLGMSICNGWAAMSSTIVVGLAQGGTVVVLYGLIGISIINAFLAMSLGEMASAWPSAGGQYVWSALLAPDARTRRGVSYSVGFITIFSWITIVASVVLILGDVIFALVELYNPNFAIQRWQVYLVYLAVNILSVVYNIFAHVRVPSIGKFFFYFSSVVAVIIFIVVLAKAPHFNDSKFVWGTYTNEIGWSSPFVVVMTGLVNPGYVFAGLDGAVKLSEDSKQPEKAVPLALLSTVGMGLLTGFAMSLALIYTVQDLDAALSAELPFLTIIVQATNGNTAGAILMVAFLVCLFISANSVHAATSRLIYSFARDNALPCSRAMSKIHPVLRVPVIPLVLSGTGVAILGVLYVASTTAYNSIIGTCIILGNISFAIPAFQLLMCKRRLPADRWFKLGWLGAVSNIVTIVFCLLTTVMWLFPLTPNPAAEEMNYGCAVLGGMALIAALVWIFYARHHFVAPTMDTIFEESVADERSFEK